jgi:hypothetical protein
MGLIVIAGCSGPAQTNTTATSPTRGVTLKQTEQ